MQTCLNCGTASEGKFCSRCGAPLVAPPPASPLPAVPPPAQAKPVSAKLGGVALTICALIAAAVYWHYSSFGPAADPNSPGGVAAQWAQHVADGRPSLALPLMVASAQNAMQDYFISELGAQWKLERGSLSHLRVRGVEEQETTAIAILDLDFSRSSFAMKVPLLKENGVWKVKPP
jgi:hypothetical protein